MESKHYPTVKINIENIDEINSAIEEVMKRVEELHKAIQRLNDIGLAISLTTSSS